MELPHRLTEGRRVRWLRAGRGNRARKFNAMIESLKCSKSALMETEEESQYPFQIQGPTGVDFL